MKPSKPSSLIPHHSISQICPLIFIATEMILRHQNYCITLPWFCLSPRHFFLNSSTFSPASKPSVALLDLWCFWISFSRTAIAYSPSHFFLLIGLWIIPYLPALQITWSSWSPANTPCCCSCYFIRTESPSPLSQQLTVSPGSNAASSPRKPVSSLFPWYFFLK